MSITSPLPLFDDLEHVEECGHRPLAANANREDFQRALNFLKNYTGSKGTFNSYRREIERLLHWSWLVANKSIKELRREDIENFIRFCQQPSPTWIGTIKVPRFVIKDGIRIANQAWRPFIVTVSKTAYRQGLKPDVKNFSLSDGAVKESFAILSSFYNYLIQEEYTLINPVMLVRQKSKFIRKQQGTQQIRRLTELQWRYVITTAEKMAQENPALHERTLFIMTALYSMYLRISELAANKRWTPSMNHFYRDHNNLWWFTTVGKGNKERQIAVSDSMLVALKRYRQHLGLTALPSITDNSPLIPKAKTKGAISSTTYVREIVQECFDQAIKQLAQDNYPEEAELLVSATVHWLRHTGISDDVKHRPREHVRDDAGHSSSAITDKYIDIQLIERHQSAKKKTIIND